MSPKRSFGRRRHFGGNRKFSRGKSGKTALFRDVSKFINKTANAVGAIEYKSVRTFDSFALDARLQNNIVTKGYKQPSPIQDQAIPHIMDGRDLVGLADTGTGKTAAFVIPLLNKTIKNGGEKVMIVAPTRELAIQINQEIIKFATGLRIFSVCAVGGMPIYRQIADLRRGHNFVIGTPGRIKDLIKRGCIKMDTFKIIVLDEADRMLEMGFVNDMRFLMTSMPKERQTLFFSATVSAEANKIIEDFLSNPVRISVKTRDTASAVHQDVVYITDTTKLDVLHDLLSKPEFNKVLVFGRTKHGVERLSGDLQKKGIKAESIHGNKNHSQRQRALTSFKNDAINVLVATDVAARGLDIPDVSHVINYELPSTYEDYIHRIGRTGRGGKTGKALTFVERFDSRHKI